MTTAMPDDFDPYYKWLAIAPDEQPPHFYRLLAVRQFESDADVIASAADQRMAHLRTFQTGKHSGLSQQLLNEIAAARVCLLNPDRKAAYDQRLRAKLQPQAPAAPPPAPFALPTAPPSAAPVRQAIPFAAPAAGSWVPPPNAAALDAATNRAADSLATEPSIVPDSTTTRRGRKKQQSWAGAIVPFVVLGLALAIGYAVHLNINQPATAARGTASHPPNRHADDGAKAESPRSEEKPKEHPKKPADQSQGGPAANSAAPQITQVERPEPEVKHPDPQQTELLSPVVRKLLLRIAGHVADGSVEQSPPAGGGDGGLFEEIPHRGALLVGLNFGVGTFAGHVVLTTVQGVYLTTAGITSGEEHGGLGSNPVKLLARPGYAVGGINVRCGARIAGLEIVFMRIREDRLDPGDNYLSDWAGGQGGGPMLVSGDGRAAVGIFGGIGAELDRIGLMLDAEPSSSAAEMPGSEPRQQRPVASRELDLPRQDRLSVPSPEAQREALTLIHSLFKDDYAEASKSSPQKFALAEKLFHKAEETNDDPTARYVLLCEARDLAARCGNSQAVGDTIILLASLYDVDDIGMTLSSFEKVAELSTAPLPYRRRLVENCVMLIDRAVAQEKFDVAEQLGTIGKRAAAKSQDSIVAQRLLWRISRLHEQKAAFDEVSEPLEILKTRAADPQASAAVGRYRCLYQDDWQGGLPLLAQGSDAALKTIALRELADEGSPDDQCKLADNWDALAKANEKYRALYERRAKYWYERALPGMRGIQMARVEKKLAELLGGRGLKVDYFRGKDLRASNKVLTRVEPNIDFKIGRASPAPEVPSDFSARWTSLIVAPAKGEYQLTADHDDGVRIWIDNKLVIDNWASDGAARAVVSLALKPRAMKIEFHNHGDARLILKWAQKGGFAEQVIPPEAFWQEHSNGSKTFAPLPNPPYPKTFVGPRSK